MNKREEILKGLECCMPTSKEHGNCNECPYDEVCWNGSVALPAAMVEDIKDILKVKASGLEELAEDYGLTPDDVRFALEQYQTVICEITHSRMSKLSYHARDILSVADDVRCDGCELEEAQKPIKPERSGKGTYWYYCCGNCGQPLDPGDPFCRKCGKAVAWND